ncbi:MAG: nucleotide sugar dehydrogenase, partial [Acidimicrobiia bacterium]|nr:nucleotide sugar dehydrogenase [Acidimicrobiia bacterium]
MTARHRPHTPAASRLVVVGQGYVGLPLAMAAVDAGYDVIGYDVDPRRVKTLAEAESFTGDVLRTQVAAALRSGRYRVTDEDRAFEDGFDIAVVTVPTPLRGGEPDLSFVESAGDVLGRHLRPGGLVVLESTTYPGTTEDVFGPRLEARSGLVAGRDFRLAYSPERIDPGNERWTLRSTPKLVAGIDEASADAARAFYAHIVDEVVPVANVREAELAKLVENTFRHLNVALVNELAVCADDLGIDIWAALDAAATKPFGFMRFTPGPGVGGHCLPVDPTYLAWAVRQRTQRPFRLVEAANEVNHEMPRYVTRRIAETLNRQGLAVSRSRLLLLGLAYKPDTADTRESPAVAVAEL